MTLIADKEMTLDGSFTSWFVKDEASQCWLWKGQLNPNGYGRKIVNYRKMGAHRWAWEIYNGPIPKGKVVMHICDVKHCVNPQHLRLGSQKENIQDSIEKGRHSSITQGPQLFCRRGKHALVGENIYIRSDGKRECHACIKLRRYLRKKGLSHG